MSNFYALAALPWDWVLLSGGLGGALNAACSSNLRLFPSWSRDPAGSGIVHVIRVGLIASSVVGAIASLGLLWALRGLATLDAVDMADVPLRFIASSLFVGFVTARVVTNEVDKALLRLAVRSAASAPAAHPEVTEAIDHAPPDAVYRIAMSLMPRRRPAPPGSIHVGTAFEKAHPQRS